MNAPDYTAAPRSFHEILAILARTSTGREVLSRIYPDLTSGKVTIEAYPEELLTLLRAHRPEGEPVGATFTTDGLKGKIYLDLTSPLGVLAPFLIHEMVHSLDAALWYCANRSVTRAQIRSVKLQSEESAFQIQNRFVSELKTQCQEFSGYIELVRSSIRTLQDLSSEEVRALYSDAA